MQLFVLLQLGQCLISFERIAFLQFSYGVSFIDKLKIVLIYTYIYGFPVVTFFLFCLDYYMLLINTLISQDFLALNIHDFSR